MSSGPSLDAEDHTDGAKRLAAEAVVLDKANLHGWAVVALFYSALHWTRAYLFAKAGIRVREHKDMARYWDEFPELKKIRGPYDFLKQESQKARYYLVAFAANDTKLLTTRLEWVRQGVEKLLKALPK